jgi:hypothetical protein
LYAENPKSGKSIRNNSKPEKAEDVWMRDCQKNKGSTVAAGLSVNTTQQKCSQHRR